MLTPNPDTLYFMAFLNTKDAGPIVIEVPPAGADGSLNANFVNIWQQPLEATQMSLNRVLTPSKSKSIPSQRPLARRAQNRTWLRGDVRSPIAGRSPSWTALAARLNVNHPFAAPSVNMNVVNRRGPDLFPVISLVRIWFTRRERKMRRALRLDGMSFHKVLKS